ncbi:MAG: MSHA biogenesis protein MshQ, partial [Aeromonas sp.]|nr:MSHA biogenesis protein MshQ [Aeromonas sp.]
KPGVEAVVGKQNYDHAIAAGSINTMTQSLNEVGVFRMTATPPTLGYFGYTIPAASSVPVGRFVPWDFNLMSSDVVPACEDMTAPERDFTYMSQQFGIELEVVARNMAGGQTQNYTGLFAKGEAYITTANNKDGNSLSSRLRSRQPLPWLNGRAAFTGTSEFVRLSDTQPDGPYKSLLFGLYMRDNDGDHSLIASPNFNDAVVGDCSGSGCNARLLDSVPMQAYFGRLLASTRQGVASAPLALPLQVQYFEGGGWKINQADVCTQLSLANNGFDPATILDPTRKISFNNGSYEVTGQVPGATPPQSFRSTLTLSGLAAPASVATANKGEILFHFTAPNVAVRIPYKVELSKQPSRPLWLLDPLTQAGEAIFGSTRGNDRIIYRREVMP